MRSWRFFLAILTVLCSLGTGAAFAQDKIDMRVSRNDGYGRLAVEWPGPPAYSLSKQGERLLVRFSRAGASNPPAAAADTNVRGVEIISAAGEPFQIAVTIPPGSRFRDFTVGNKMVLDIYDPPKDAGEGATEKPDSAAPDSPKTQSAKPADAGEAPPPAVADQKPAPRALTAAEPATAVPVEKVEAAPVAAQKLDPHVVTLTTVTNVAIAAFERNGYLWMVLDMPDLPAAPQLNGPQKARFGGIEKIPAEGGAAYRLLLPDGIHAKGEGGGLSWRLVLSPRQPDAASAASPSVKDSALAWPLKDMRKVVTMTDPDAGDSITAITSPMAAQFAGAPRSFVNLTTLDSVIGLAYVAKSDDVAAQVGASQVVVGRPGGLTLAGGRDSAPSQIRAAIGTEAISADAPVPADGKDGEAAPAAASGEADHHEDADKAGDHKAASTDLIAKAAGEKPSGNNIYNFPRWELGGVSALENNQHVLMVEIANKPPGERTEDVLTMVKLLLANDRAPEALGLLRIALSQVPELGETPEFLSLTGAALALAGKFDEAFNTLRDDRLKDYDDVKFWRAYTLGGLEDWKQAGQMLPADMAPIVAYPKPLKTKLALMFAEIALRNGRLNEANGILDLLRPELDHLSLANASSWKYLAGEAERQAGNVKQAKEYWQPLIKNGKDDLYRAKAGLSLTKLQLDNKEIKPAEAINRLEGLRYAWRGDELETLINYRLGQVYLDNKDYLKGLTVLRGAVGITPDLQVGREVKTAMVKGFRDVFANDRLKDVSPLEAIGLYEEFKDLVPPGDEADDYVDQLSERLVDADLLGRAAVLLDHQVNHRLTGARRVDTAIRLAAIRLLDGNPDGALRALEIAQAAYDKFGMPAAAQAAAPQDVAPQAGGEAPVNAGSPVAADTAVAARDPEKQRQILLLRARALSMKKKTDEALAILDQMEIDPDSSRLRTDIAWSAGRWDAAAVSLDDLIIAEDISARRPLTEYQRDLILNRAIALNLSNDRVSLANLRERFNAQMKGTTKGQMFEVITRPRRPDMIGSREAIESMISEIAMFDGFVEGYAKLDEEGKPAAQAATGEATPSPGQASGSAPATAATPASASPAAE